jgi:hypothetical protein
MATVIEREIHHSQDASESSAAAIIVAIIALVVIAGFALYFFQLYPGAAPATDNDAGINVDIDGQIPVNTTPDANQ